jgi:hypothetical protein
MLNIFFHGPLVHPDNSWQLFQLAPFTISNDLRPNSSMILKLDKNFIAVSKAHQFLLRSPQEIRSYEKNGTAHLCQGRQTIRNDMLSSLLFRMVVCDKVNELEFIPAMEQFLIFFPNK